MADGFDLAEIAAILPQETTVTLPARFLWFKYKKVYSVRAFSLRDKIYFLRKYGEKKFTEISGDVTNIEFQVLHMEILYNLLKNRRDFKTFDKFLERIIGLNGEVKALSAALTARGASTAPLLKNEEVMEIIEEVKKKAAEIKAQTAAG